MREDSAGSGVVADGCYRVEEGKMSAWDPCVAELENGWTCSISVRSAVVRTNKVHMISACALHFW